MSDLSFDYNNLAVVKCESCGADMEYDPAVGKLSCAYCKSTRDIEKRVSGLRNYVSECEHGAVEADDGVYKCPNCGGVVEFGGFQTATVCPFCGAPSIVKLQDIKGMKPDSILPFRISKQLAYINGKGWLKKRIFAPSKCRKTLKAENFKGVYIPSFAFNSDTYSTYYGRFGVTRTRTVGTGKDRHTETYIHWFDDSGSCTKAFDNITVEASPQIKQKELKKLMPFDMNNAEAYTREYLAGFTAERHDLSLADSFGVAKGEMDELIRKAITSRYEHVDYVNVSTKYSKIKFRYTLLPIWVCAYMYKGKKYRFLANGRTSKFTGKTPVSGVKVGAFVAGVLSVIAAIALLVCHFSLGIF